MYLWGCTAGKGSPEVMGSSNASSHGIGYVLINKENGIFNIWFLVLIPFLAAQTLSLMFPFCLRCTDPRINRIQFGELRK